MNPTRLYKGYAYRLDYRAAKDSGVVNPPIFCTDDHWDIVVIDDLIGNYIGERSIDGCKCRVIEWNGEYYASKSFGKA